MSALEPDTLCTCGHVYDEHYRGRECMGVLPDMEGSDDGTCPCVHFDSAEVSS